MWPSQPSLASHTETLDAYGRSSNDQSGHHRRPRQFQRRCTASKSSLEKQWRLVEGTPGTLSDYIINCHGSNFNHFALISQMWVS